MQWQTVGMVTVPPGRRQPGSYYWSRWQQQRGGPSSSGWGKGSTPGARTLAGEGAQRTDCVGPSPARTARWLSRRSQAPGRKVQAELPHHPSHPTTQGEPTVGSYLQQRVQAASGDLGRWRRGAHRERGDTVTAAGCCCPTESASKWGECKPAPPPPQVSSPPSSTPGHISCSIHPGQPVILSKGSM